MSAFPIMQVHRMVDSYAKTSHWFHLEWNGSG